MLDNVDGQGRRRGESRHQNPLFYADYGMIVSSYPGWMQEAFRKLVGLFDRVGLRANEEKTAGMVCCLCQAAGTQSEAAYKQWMMGRGLSYRMRQRVKVQCSK